MTQQNTGNGSICAEEYVVKRGDSFYLIAHKLGVPLRDLLAANSDIHPARLMVGDVLCIPREEDDSASGGLGGNGGTTGGSSGSGTGSGSGGNSSTGGGSGGTSGGGSTGGGTTGGSSGSGTGSGSGGNSSTGGGSGGSSGGGTTGGSSGSSSGSGTGSGSGGNSSTGGGSGGSVTPSTPSCPLDEQLIVQRGQSVSDIQLLNLVSRNTLASANPNIDLDSLRVGQTICVPKENIPCAVPTTYTLAKTETL